MNLKYAAGTVVILSAVAFLFVWRSSDLGTEPGTDSVAATGPLTVSDACREYYDEFLAIHLDAGFPVEYVNTIWEMSFAAEEYDDPEVFAEELFEKLVPMMEQVVAGGSTNDLANLTEMLTRIEDLQQSIPPDSDCR